MTTNDERFANRQSPIPKGTVVENRKSSGLLAKVVLLFVVLNLAFALVDPLPWLGHISAYNTLLPGRARLPYGDNPERAYNLSLFNLDAMFASHELAGRPKPAGEYRVLLIGDSSTWGWLLQPADTLAANLNAADLTVRDGRHVRAYNLGYPIMSLTKDLLILDAAKRYQPDLIVWLVTLESFPVDKQLAHPLLQRNPAAVRRLIATYGLRLDPNDPAFANPSFLDRTIVGRRRDLADLLRLQLYGVMWAATGIDQDYPPYEPAAIDLAADESFHDLKPPTLHESDLAFDVLAAGQTAAGATPGAPQLLIVNEPILISAGQNSTIRYNFFYPRWAYDQYRAMLAAKAQQQGWHYLDVWDILPPSEFTNSAVHYTPAGSKLLAARVGQAILSLGPER